MRVAPITPLLTISLITLLTWASPLYAGARDHYCDRPGRPASEINRQAYDFGRKIQEAFRGRDIDQVYALIDEDDWNGPRYKLAKQYTFDEIFPPYTVGQFINTTPRCRPVNWRGYMLSQGIIWYNYSVQGELKIFAMNGGRKETIQRVSDPAWRVNGKLVPYVCLTRVLPSEDIFEEYARLFHIEQKKFFDFTNHPGQYLGKEITNLEPLPSPWCSPGNCREPRDETLSIFRYLDNCQPQARPNRVTETEVRIDLKEEDVYGNADSYEIYYVIQNLPLALCADLGPSMPGTCDALRLVYSEEFYGGSMGPQAVYGIYGLYTMLDGRQGIAPLEYLGGENYILNYFEKLGYPLPSKLE